MTIERSGQGAVEQPGEAGFTGDVRIIGYYRRDAPSNLAGATMTFEPGARTPWKVNRFGQTIIVLSGTGRVQAEGAAMEEVRPGDVIWWQPGERHWEGAVPHGSMSYVAIQEEDGTGVSFGDAVSDAQYRGEAR